MLFNSAEYLFLFLPIVLAVFIYLAHSDTTESQINWLILGSLVFYGSWNPIYVCLIVLSVVVNFFIGRQVIARIGGSSARTWLIVGIVFNLGLLGYFKYAGFFVSNLNALGLWLIPVPQIVLPLAISFFTFQQIAYLVDVARGQCKEYQFRHYALFVLFFPQLIAGPIVHHREMMPQFKNLRRIADLWPDLSVGLTIIAIGLFKKVVLADSVAQYADPLFSAAAQGQQLSSVDAWVATLSFSFQIYFDFSGYSDIAIGSARLFGIRLPENFRSPYKASSIIEIWNRWHITLSRFLAEYLYFALGGNRRGDVRRYLNLFITMLLGGLWHGAAWTYVIWGAMHGFYLWINHAWRALIRKLGMENVFGSPLLKPLHIFLTFIAWSVAAVVFRASDMHSAIAIIVPSFSQFSVVLAPLLETVISDTSLGRFFMAFGAESGSYLSVYCLLAVCTLICWFAPNTQQIMRRYDPVYGEGYSSTQQPSVLEWQPGWLTAIGVAVLLTFSLLCLSNITQFFYFQF